MSQPVIALRGITKVYVTGEVEVRAVGGVSLEIGRGEFVAIMGASGSGKSTMMNILGCLDRPTDGRYLLDDVDVVGLNRRQLAQLRNRKIGFVFQSFNLLSRTTAMENVELPLFYSEPAVALRERHRRAREALEKVGLGARLTHRPSQLSGGQQQRIAIAAYCKRIVIMRDGHLLEDRANATPNRADELRARLDREEREAHIGERPGVH